MRMWPVYLCGLVALIACGPEESEMSTLTTTDSATTNGTTVTTTQVTTTTLTTTTTVSTTGSSTVTSTTGTGGGDPFADAVVSFELGEGAGFGEVDLPDIVLGAPNGAGEYSGGLDVLSLGDGGEIVLELTDIGVVDGDGIDLLIFENPFVDWIETGRVAISEDGVIWHEFPCEPTNAAQGYPGCAGVEPVFAAWDNGIDPTNPVLAGGDPFDLAQLGVKRARFIRITDTGYNNYDGIVGGFDLDALAVVNGEPL